jgi:hypothetical protein
VRSAHSNHAVSIPRIGEAEGGVALEQSLARFEKLIASVSCCRDDNNSAFDQPFAFFANWPPALLPTCLDALSVVWARGGIRKYNRGCELWEPLPTQYFSSIQRLVAIVAASL